MITGDRIETEDGGVDIFPVVGDGVVDISNEEIRDSLNYTLDDLLENPNLQIEDAYLSVHDMFASLGYHLPPFHKEWGPLGVVFELTSSENKIPLYLFFSYDDTDVFAELLTVDELEELFDVDY